MPNAHRTVCLTAILSSIVVTTAPAQVPDQDYPRNILYLEVTPLLFIGNVSVNYERRVNDWLHARVGVGTGYVFLVYAAATAAGGTVMLLYATPNSDHKFEAGLGVSVVTTLAGNPGTRVLPALALGYRHESANGGFFFRAGGSLTAAFGFPIQVSFGLNF
jgi:hypothetical protein